MKSGALGASDDEQGTQQNDDDEDTPWHRDVWGDLDERFLGDGSVSSEQSDIRNDDTADQEDTT
jgi:hypothetical protein